MVSTVGGGSNDAEDRADEKVDSDASTSSLGKRRNGRSANGFPRSLGVKESDRKWILSFTGSERISSHWF